MGNKKVILDHVEEHDDDTVPSIHLDLWYPDVKGNTRAIVIGLMDVRAADDIRVSYDKERDGWKIEQASTFKWEADDPVCDPDWQEVAFIQAWAREKTECLQCGNLNQPTRKQCEKCNAILEGGKDD
ncbi:hypothetical protein M0R36_10890 [bacterium]|nr:hypothetical protein [bacterium]